MLKEEIWGCHKYMNIPLDTIYSMPIMDRKFFIHKHNEDIKKQESMVEKNSNEKTIEGINLNSYAKKEQQNNKKR